MHFILGVEAGDWLAPFLWEFWCFGKEKRSKLCVD